MSVASQVYDNAAYHPVDVVQEWQVVTSSASASGEAASAAFAISCAGVLSSLVAIP